MTEFRIDETGAVINVEIADSIIKRFLGLMGRRRLESGKGLFLTPCDGIHMCFHQRFDFNQNDGDNNANTVNISNLDRNINKHAKILLIAGNNE